MSSLCQQNSQIVDCSQRGRYIVTDVLDRLMSNFAATPLIAQQEATMLVRMYTASAYQTDHPEFILAGLARWCLVEDEHAAICCTTDADLKVRIQNIANFFDFSKGAPDIVHLHAAAYAADEACRSVERAHEKEAKASVALLLAAKLGETLFCVLSYMRGNDNCREFALDAANIASRSLVGLLSQAPKRSPQAVAATGRCRDNPLRRHYNEWEARVTEANQAAQRKALQKMIQLLNEQS